MKCQSLLSSHQSGAVCYRLAPETPGFRMLCPDETHRGFVIVVEDLHKSYVNFSNFPSVMQHMVSVESSSLLLHSYLT